MFKNIPFLFLIFLSIRVSLETNVELIWESTDKDILKSEVEQIILLAKQTLARIITFVKAKHKKSDGQTTIAKYMLAAHEI